jgi:tetratricopeptide (TPR) repeat protein
MSRRDKKEPNTGSPLLGAELRRLRGIRTLEEIATLSKAPPLAGSVPPLSSSALCEIEFGRQMPRLTTLYTLSMVYRVSMNQLMGYIVEENLAKAAVEIGEATGEDPSAAFARLLSVGEWHRALPLALHCERNATTEQARIAWRGNRATCLARVGLHTEAVTLLTSCLESRAISRRQEFAILQMLGDIQKFAGNFKTADTHLKEALERVPDEAAPGEIANLEAIRAELIVRVQDDAGDVSERAVREAIKLSERAEKGRADDPSAVLRIRATRAWAFRLLGNRTLALRDLEAILREAVERRYSAMEVRASLDIARLRQEAGHLPEARALLERGKSIAEAAQQFDLVFEASLALFLLLRAGQPGTAVTHFRRCRELLALLPSNSPMVQEFGRLAQEIAG